MHCFTTVPLSVENQQRLLHAKAQSPRHFLRHNLLKGVACVMAIAVCADTTPAADYSFTAKSTLTPVELNHGDKASFKLLNGQTRTLELVSTSAGRMDSIVFYMKSTVIVDGKQMEMIRYLPTQESFYEPYVVDGMQIYFDGLQALFSTTLLTENHGECKPNRHARFVLVDATQSICPVKLKPWYANDAHIIRVQDCYTGEDVNMGPYIGSTPQPAAHGGLDINMAKGTGVFAPFDIDDHVLFNSYAAGSNNNRWNGWHVWGDSSKWTINTHHQISMTVEDHKPFKAGELYANAAGVHVGLANHSHFMFRAKEKNGTEMYIDPWILFRQIFEDERERIGEIRAKIVPFGPSTSGSAVHFSSDGSRAGKGSSVALEYFWTFGDGGSSCDRSPNHTFLKPGLFPVTLTVFDGVHRASCTHHITVSGSNVGGASVAVHADDPTFDIRAVSAMDVYGFPGPIPHTLTITTRPGTTQNRDIAIANGGSGTLADVSYETAYTNGSGWLSIQKSGTGNNQQLQVTVSAGTLSEGIYRAVVSVQSAGAINATGFFRVEMRVSSCAAVVMVNDADEECYITPHAWVGRGAQGGGKGFGSHHKTNGPLVDSTARVRFTPDLQAGEYEVLFNRDYPTTTVSCKFRVKSTSGISEVTATPTADAVLGTFTFADGNAGYVEVTGAKANTRIDALVFRKKNTTSSVIVAAANQTFFCTQKEYDRKIPMTNPIPQTDIRVIGSEDVDFTVTSDVGWMAPAPESSVYTLWLHGALRPIRWNLDCANMTAGVHTGNIIITPHNSSVATLKIPITLIMSAGPGEETSVLPQKTLPGMVPVVENKTVFYDLRGRLIPNTQTGKFQHSVRPDQAGSAKICVEATQEGKRRKRMLGMK